jgi:nicotinate dehydrogenase subunit B
VKPPLYRPLNRREVLLGSGALIVSFSLHAAASKAPVPKTTAKPLPGSLAEFPLLDSWIRIDADNSITVFSGKAELGQGLRTAILQIAAEELDVAVTDIILVTADTARTPDEGYTAGSQSLQYSGTAIRYAAAQARSILLEVAAARFALPESSLHAREKAFFTPDGRSVKYGELIADTSLHIPAAPDQPLKAPSTFRVIGKSIQRVDIPAKVTGGSAFVQDLRLPGMCHARVLRPPSYAAELTELNAGMVEAMPGVVAVIRDGGFVAVVARKEFQAIRAMRELAAVTKWSEHESLPDQNALPAALLGLERDAGSVAEQGQLAFVGRTFEATFTRPYQMHGSIGPSCAVALMHEDGTLNVWSHTQGVFPDRQAICEMLGMDEEKVRISHVEGSGCYGHNGADDAAADAALIASKIPGTPVRVQWMREQEHCWEPYGPAMVTKVKASLDESGRISDWSYDLWSNSHLMRPGGAGALLAARAMARQFPPTAPKFAITKTGNGDRNANPAYAIPNRRVLWHFLPEMPVRVSSLRSLGAYANVFSIESSMDELAHLAHADPIAFRLGHLEDSRARAVIEEASRRFRWNEWKPAANRGRGFAFAMYKNLASYFAVAIEVEVEPATGRVRVIRAISSIDSGEVVNPDGIRNQTEGGILQSMSWTLFESVSFNRTRITSNDWASYPILRFANVPEKVEVHIIDRPGAPFLGAGEAAQGPTCAAIANAVSNATGKRLYDLPLSRDRIRDAVASVK